MQLSDLNQRKVLAIFSGGFHPFHSGHFSVYDYLRKKFPKADVYIAATNSTAERPFTFEQKQFLASQAGVPKDRFVEVKSPYRADEITKNYNPEETILIFGLSSKDKDRLGKPIKKDGTLAYMQPYPGSLDKCDQLTKHAYYIVVPAIKFSIFGQEINSASQIRQMYAEANNSNRLRIAKELYPQSKDLLTVKKVLDKALVNKKITENLHKPKIEFNGWFSPDGKFYPQDTTDFHIDVLKNQNIKTYSDAYNLGWVRFKHHNSFGELTSSKHYVEIKNQLEKLIPKLIKNYPILQLECASGIYRLVGNNFKKVFKRLDEAWFQKPLLTEKERNEIFSELIRYFKIEKTIQILISSTMDKFHLGSISYDIGRDQTTSHFFTITINSNAAKDKKIYKAVLAHELCHAEDVENNWLPYIDDYNSIPEFIEEVTKNSHSASWQKIANRINAKYGKNFVTISSDQTFKYSIFKNLKAKKNFPVQESSSHFSDLMLLERIGPHNYKEAEMLIAGTKPAGLISSPTDKRHLIPYIRDGRLIVRREPEYQNFPKNSCWIVGQANNKAGVDAIYDLLKKKNEEWDELGSWVVSQRPNTEYHTKLGRLLGYSEEDINFAHNAWEKMRQAKRDSPEYTNDFNPRKIKENLEKFPCLSCNRKNKKCKRCKGKGYIIVKGFDAKKKAANDLNEATFDNMSGLGVIPHVHNEFLRGNDGILVKMKPSIYLSLVSPIVKWEAPEKQEYIDNHVKSNKSIATPLIRFVIPNSWFKGDYSEPATVRGHEGRHRMKAINKLEGDQLTDTILRISDEKGKIIPPNQFKKEWLMLINKQCITQSNYMKDNLEITKGPFFTLK